MNQLTRYGDDNPGRFEWIDERDADCTYVYVKDRICGGTLYIRQSWDWRERVQAWMARQPSVVLEEKQCDVSLQEWEPTYPRLLRMPLPSAKNTTSRWNWFSTVFRFLLCRG